MPLSLHLPPSPSPSLSLPQAPAAKSAELRPRCQGISHMLEWKGLPVIGGALLGFVWDGWELSVRPKPGLPTWGLVIL